MSKKMHRNALQTNHTLHWYLIEDILGQGGFGITYLAHDMNLDQKVAIKEYLPIELAVREGDHSVYPVSEGHDERYRWGLDRFILEARTLAQFRHPNIVRVLSVFEDNNTAYMVMDYESGQSFQEVLSQPGQMDEMELIQVLFPILGGLRQVHEAGFIHRDIKPANIFLRDDDSPVLLDFGSARQALGEQTKTLTSIVSPGYAPYEQYYSKGDKQGPWTDIYGLGATMYRAITGRPPMDAIDRSEAILKTSQDTFVPALEIGAGKYSRRFLQAIDHAICFDPDKRPQSINDWLAEFEVPDEMVTVVAGEPDTDIRSRSRRMTRQPTPPPVPDTEAETAISDVSKVAPAAPASVSPVQTATRTRAAEPVSEQGPTPRRGLGLLLVICLLVSAVAAGLYLHQQGLLPFGSDQPDMVEISARTAEPPTPAQPEPEPAPVPPEPEPVVAEPEPEAPVAEPEPAPEIVQEPEPEQPSRREQEISRLLEQADRALADGRLSSPFNDSALFYYQSVLELSADNREAHRGMDRIRERLMARATSARDAGNLDRAQDVLIQAQALFPNDTTLQQQYRDLLAARQEANNRQQVQDLLEQATRATIANRLTEPAGDNAVYYYRQILALNDQHAGARSGLQLISTRLLDEARQRAEAGELDEAETLLASAREVSVESSSLEAMVSDEIARQRRVANQAQQQDQTVDRLLSEAEDHIEALRLSSPAGNNALENYRTALKLDPGNSTALAGLDRLLGQYVGMANRAIDSDQLERADEFLARADSIRPGTDAVASARIDLDRARQEIQRQQQAQEQQRLEQQRQAEQQRLAEQKAREEAEKQRQEAEAQRLLAEQREAARKERERQEAEANRKLIVVTVTGVDDRKFKSINFTHSGLMEKTIQQLTAKGWEIISEQEAMNKPNALLMNIKFSANFNTSVGFYSYAIAVNIHERAKVPVPNGIFSPAAIWNKGDSGIAQPHQLNRINGIVEGQVASFLGGL